MHVVSRGFKYVSLTVTSFLLASNPEVSGLSAIVTPAALEKKFYRKKIIFFL